AGETLLQRCHQIDDFALLLLWHFDFDDVFVLLPLFLNQLQKLFSLLVLQFFQRELFGGMLLDQLLEFLHGYRWSFLIFRQSDVFWRTNFIGKAHRLSAQDFVLGKNRDQILFAAHHESRDARELFFFHRVRQEFVSLL